MANRAFTYGLPTGPDWQTVFLLRGGLSVAIGRVHYVGSSWKADGFPALDFTSRASAADWLADHYFRMGGVKE